MMVFGTHSVGELLNSCPHVGMTTFLYIIPTGFVSTCRIYCLKYCQNYFSSRPLLGDVLGDYCSEAVVQTIVQVTILPPSWKLLKVAVKIRGMVLPLLGNRE